MPSRHAAFVELPARNYTILGLTPDGSASVSRARLQYRFFPGKSPNLPLCTILSGGPGVTSAMMQKAFGITRTDDGQLAPACHALFIDARNTGFSYNIAEEGETARPGFAIGDNNPYIDAADFVMVLLEFFEREPQLAQLDSVLVGESYGGVRTTIMLDMLLGPERYVTGERNVVDEDLAARIVRAETELGVRFAEQVRHQVLLQPTLAGTRQDEATGELFEQPGSVLHRLAAELGQTFEPCATSSCLPYFNAINRVEAWGRSAYNYSEAAGWLDRKIEDAHALMETEAGAALLLGVAPMSIELFGAEHRRGAWRVSPESEIPQDSDWSRQALGELDAGDRYFIAFHDTVFGAFSSSQAINLGVDWLDPLVGALFLRNCRTVHTFLTRASFDLVNYSPGLLSALEGYPGIADVEVSSSGAEVRPGQVLFRYDDGATVSIRSPEYEAGHGIIGDAGPLLTEDIRLWLEQTP